MQIDTDNMSSTFDGYKTYITLIIGIVTVVVNHFYPDTMKAMGLTLDPNNWLQQVFTLLLGMTGRSALKKVETAPSAPKS